MARGHQQLGRRSDEVFRNAIAAGVVTAGNSTNVSNAFGGLGPTATAGANGVAITWLNTNSNIIPVVVCQAIGTASTPAAAAVACVTAFASGSAGIVAYVGAGQATSTAQIHVAVFGQARNDFMTT